jgi:hypothetical protein
VSGESVPVVVRRPRDHRRVGWEVFRQLPPLATDRRNVEDCIYHRSHVCRPWLNHPASSSAGTPGCCMRWAPSYRWIRRPHSGLAVSASKRTRTRSRSGFACNHHRDPFASQGQNAFLLPIAKIHDFVLISSSDSNLSKGVSVNDR